MSIPLFHSDSTTALRQALTAAYPGCILAVDEKPLDGTRTVTVSAIDYSLDIEGIATHCVDMFGRARALCTLPVSVSVVGAGGAGALLDTEIDQLADALSAKFGVTAIVLSAYGAAGPEYARLLAITADPEHSRILTEIINPK